MSKASIYITNLARDIEGHYHDHGQVLMPLSGFVFVKSDTADYVIDEKTIALVPPGLVHYYNGSLDNRVLVIDFPKSVLKKEDAIQLDDIRAFYQTERMKLVKELFLMEMEAPAGPFTQDYLFFYLYDLLLSKPLCVSVEYISRHYDSPLSIGQLAKMEHYSENYYRQWFRKKTGLSPSEYIHRLRIEKAKELLISTKYSISEIAYQVGFSHNSSFTRAFKDLEGDYPSSYRKREME